MIVRPRTNFFQLFFVMHGSVVPRIAPQIFGFVVYAALAVALVRLSHVDLSGFTLAPFGLIGVTLSIYLGFRNIAAYNRWREARKLWGQLVFDIRNFSRAVAALLPYREQARPLLMGTLAFCHLLRGLPRRSDMLAVASVFSRRVGRGSPIFQPPGRRRPSARFTRRRARPRRLGPAHPRRAAGIAFGAAGGVRAYHRQAPALRLYLARQRTAYLYCLMLPWGLVWASGWTTPLLTAFVAYTFFGLDALSAEMEDPFGMEPNDLALDGLCRVCEISVLEALGEPAPQMLPPKDLNYS